MDNSTVNNLMETIGFTDVEKKFIVQSSTAVTKEMNQSRVLSEFYFVKNLEKISDEMIQSNEKLSRSNNTYAKGMLYLTGGIVFVGIVQIIIALISN